MSSNEASAGRRRLGGTLVTDRRGADEAVMIMRLAPGDDGAFAALFERTEVIGVVHMVKNAAGTWTYDRAAVPALLNAEGTVVEAYAPAARPQEIDSLVARLKARLGAKAGGAPQAGAVENMDFFAFEKGSAGPWFVGYAGKVYPLEAPGDSAP